MATFQDMLDAIGLIVGGTAPDAVNNPHFFSGFQAGDGTGMAGIRGCWSVPPGTLQDSPMALVLPGTARIEGPEKADVFIPGQEWNVDDLRLQLFVADVDQRTSWAILNPFRDLIPALFRNHMRLSSTAWPVLADGGAFPAVLTSMVREMRPGVMSYADTEYIGWECTLMVQRVLQPVYAP